jgi:hypothetical protein
MRHNRHEPNKAALSPLLPVEPLYPIQQLHEVRYILHNPRTRRIPCDRAGVHFLDKGGKLHKRHATVSAGRHIDNPHNRCFRLRPRFL